MKGSVRRTRLALRAAVVPLVLAFGSAAAQQGAAQGGVPARQVLDGVFTPEQATRGKASYEGVCARCHGVQLTGGADAGPALKGSTFLSHWDSDTLGSLFVKIRDTMPRNTPGTISDEVKIEVVAYLLQQNGFPAGASELKVNLAVLDEVRIALRGVWDGVFTAAQADRGKAAAGRGRCTGCHGLELGGTERAPTLKGATFLANWEDGSVNRLFVKIRDTMPPANTDQLPPAEKLDVVAFLLRENGFPAGSRELTPDQDSLETIHIVKKGQSGGGAPNFALVHVVGCLTGDANSGWRLTNATEPVVTREETPTEAALKNAQARPLGRQSVSLVSVSRSLKPESMDGQKVEARGLLYREQAYTDLNLTSLRPVASSCN
jgi:mono/diheme cytochrome c family protein